jgi:hypothetical protein
LLHPRAIEALSFGQLVPSARRLRYWQRSAVATPAKTASAAAATSLPEQIDPTSWTGTGSG